MSCNYERGFMKGWNGKVAEVRQVIVLVTSFIICFRTSIAIWKLKGKGPHEVLIFIVLSFHPGRAGYHKWLFPLFGFAP